MIVSLHLRTYYCDAASENLATLDTKGKGGSAPHLLSVSYHTCTGCFFCLQIRLGSTQPGTNSQQKFLFLFTQVPETREISVLVGALLKRLQPSLPSANKSNIKHIKLLQWFQGIPRRIYIDETTIHPIRKAAPASGCGPGSRPLKLVCWLGG